MSEDAAITNEEQNLPDPSSTSVCSLGFNPVPKLLESPPHTTTSSIFNTSSPPKTPEHVANQITSSIFNSLSDQPRKYSPIQEVITPTDEYNNSSSSSKNSVTKSISNGEFELLHLQKPITNGFNTKPGRCNDFFAEMNVLFFKGE